MLFHPTYFPTILQYQKMIEAKAIIFEVSDNFQKQTYRNRCYIYGANGKQLLNIPVIKGSSKQKTKDIKISYAENWQKEHLKSLDSAYKSSPFYEFYIDDILPIFSNKTTFLLDFNIKIFELVNSLLPINISYSKSTEYQVKVKNDYRFLVHAKQEITAILPKYRQVFSEKHGFIKNLSILDLLFNEGPNAILYVEKNSYYYNKEYLEQL